MSVTLKVDMKGFDKEMRRFARDLQALPSGRENPLQSWDIGYSRRTAKAGRPTILRSGTFRGNRWRRLSPNTVGNVMKGKGRKNSTGNRYKATDKILGKLRAQGMLGDFVMSRPKLSNRNKTLVRRSGKVYAAAHAFGTSRIPARPFHWGRKIAREESRHLTREVAKYIRRQLRRRFR